MVDTTQPEHEVSGGASAPAATEPVPEQTSNPTAGPDVAAPLLANDDSPDLAIDPEIDEDSAYDTESTYSDTTSLASAISRGYVENGRKYQATRGHEYWGPSDEKQFATMELGHMLYFILDSEQPEPLFHSPIGKNAQTILDIGTGEGTWAIEVADKYPSAIVYGVDLYPPPVQWVPPNCVFQVDDVTREWVWKEKFDLIHMRLLIGAFTPEERDAVYKSCYDNLVPGGWIEETELDVRILSDDDSINPNSLIASYGEMFLNIAVISGRPIDTQVTMRESIEKAGFVNVQEKLYKCPIGGWPRDKIFKDAGKVNMEHWKVGLEGWVMFLLTKYGQPQPWMESEVQVYLAKVRNEISTPGLHAYHYSRRVWAQKPLEETT